MGLSRIRKQAFFEAHPLCVFCGGINAAVTIEHCPPRAMFQHRAWPEGYEFPSCFECNSGSSDDDLVVALMARMDPFEDAGDRDGKVEGLIKQVRRQHPGMLAEMMPSPAEARRLNREHGVQPGPGQSHQDTGVLKVPTGLDAAIKRFAAKLSKAIYYKATNRPFPVSGEIAAHWFTNVELLRHGFIPVFRALQEVGGIMPEHVRSSRLLNDQFAVKWSLSDDLQVFILQTMLGNAFGTVTFGSVQAGQISSHLESLQRDHPSQNFSLVP